MEVEKKSVKPDMTKQGVFPWTPEEREYIVRAVKCHDALLKMARYYHQSFDYSFQIHKKTFGMNCEDCRTIAEAEGK